jgi:hypothetical protein
MSVLSSFGLSMKDEDYNLSKITQVSIQITLYRYTKPLSKLLTSIFTAIKTSLHKYNDTFLSRSGVNQMSILKSSKDLLETSISRSQYVCSSIKTFDFSTLYTIIPYTILKSRFKEWIQRCFSKKNGEQGYQYLAISLTSSKAIQYLIINITRTRFCLIDNIFVLFGERVFQ